jgi:hypothetical protein
VGGAGGSGVSSSITGSAVTRAIGGSGGSNNINGVGGGGGGAGAGGANTGGGGGGAGVASTAGFTGGSGVVIFTVPLATLVTFSSGVTFTAANNGLKTVYTVTATSTDSETVTIL